MAEAPETQEQFPGKAGIHLPPYPVTPAEAGVLSLYEQGKDPKELAPKDAAHIGN
jgi:hypothetical protein